MDTVRYKTTGIAILECSGIGRVCRRGIRDEIPLMPSVSDLLHRTAMHHRTIFSVVDNLEHAHTLVEATRSVIGDLDRQDTGLLIIMPLTEVHGLQKGNHND